eukprot:365095-Chlamydomonas_euryale.AAC.6
MGYSFLVRAEHACRLWPAGVDSKVHMKWLEVTPCVRGAETIKFPVDGLLKLEEGCAQGQRVLTRSLSGEACTCGRRRIAARSELPPAIG